MADLPRNSTCGAAVGRLEGGQEPPFSVEAQPADGRHSPTGQADASSRTSVLSYVVNGNDEGGFGFPVQRVDLLAC